MSSGVDRIPPAWVIGQNGAVLKDSLGTVLEENAYVEFEGDAVSIGDDYGPYVNRCMGEFSSRMDKYSPVDKSVDPWVQTIYPGLPSLRLRRETARLQSRWGLHRGGPS